MTFSAAFSQGLEIMVYVASKSEEEKGQYLSIPKISEAFNIPTPTVKYIISLLKKKDLISSKTGVSGGLSVKKRPSEISLYDIFVAIEGEGSVFKIHTDFDLKYFETPEADKWLEKGVEILHKSENAMLSVLKNTPLSELILPE